MSLIGQVFSGDPSLMQLLPLREQLETADVINVVNVVVVVETSRAVVRRRHLHPCSQPIAKKIGREDQPVSPPASIFRRKLPPTPWPPTTTLPSKQRWPSKWKPQRLLKQEQQSSTFRNCFWLPDKNYPPQPQPQHSPLFMQWLEK